MSRMKQLEVYREQVGEILEKCAMSGENINFAAISSHLAEISDTLALMYDKMCEKEDKEDE